MEYIHHTNKSYKTNGQRENKVTDRFHFDIFWKIPEWLIVGDNQVKRLYCTSHRHWTVPAWFRRANHLCSSSQFFGVIITSISFSETELPSSGSQFTGHHSYSQSIYLVTSRIRYKRAHIWIDYGTVTGLPVEIALLWLFFSCLMLKWYQSP